MLHLTIPNPEGKNASPEHSKLKGGKAWEIPLGTGGWPWNQLSFISRSMRFLRDFTPGRLKILNESCFDCIVPVTIINVEDKINFVQTFFLQRI